MTLCQDKLSINRVTLEFSVTPKIISNYELEQPPNKTTSCISISVISV